MSRKKISTPDDVAALAERVDRDLSAIRRAMRTPLLEQMARGQLTTPQTAVMQVVVRHDGISLKDLSREVSLAHSTVSGIADRLEKRGLIERRPDPVDGRVIRIYPTSAVTEFVREQIPLLKIGPLRAAMEKAEPTERILIETALRRLRELLES